MQICNGLIFRVSGLDPVNVPEIKSCNYRNRCIVDLAKCTGTQFCAYPEVRDSDDIMAALHSYCDSGGGELFICQRCGIIFVSYYPYPDGYLHAHWDFRGDG